MIRNRNRRRKLPLLLFCLLCPGLTHLTAFAQKSYTFGMVAKSQGNPFFEAAHSGANDAARELAATHKLKIKIDWRTPNEEDAQKQAEMIEQLILAGADGLIISWSDGDKRTGTIHK